MPSMKEYALQYQKIRFLSYPINPKNKMPLIEFYQTSSVWLEIKLLGQTPNTKHCHLVYFVVMSSSTVRVRRLWSHKTGNTLFN